MILRQYAHSDPVIAASYRLRANWRQFWLAEKRGEREIALEDYGFVARIWADADEPLRSFAAEAKEGLARLSSEP